MNAPPFESKFKLGQIVYYPSGFDPFIESSLIITADVVKEIHLVLDKSGVLGEILYGLSDLKSHHYLTEERMLFDSPDEIIGSGKLSYKLNSDNIENVQQDTSGGNSYGEVLMFKLGQEVAIFVNPASGGERVIIGPIERIIYRGVAKNGYRELLYSVGGHVLPEEYIYQSFKHLTESYFNDVEIVHI